MKLSKKKLSSKAIVNLYIAYQINFWPYEFAIGTCLFGVVRLI